MSRRARRKTETLRRIEEAGWHLFTTRGYEATSTREIAEAADIAAGTLFNYFPEKRSLLIHLMQRQIDGAVNRAFDTMTPSTLEGELSHVFAALTQCYAKERRLSRVFIKELLFTDGARSRGIGSMDVRSREANRGRGEGTRSGAESSTRPSSRWTLRSRSSARTTSVS